MSEFAKNCNEQFITRNQNQMASILIAFRECNQAYHYNLILSLCNDDWVIFDSRVGRDLFTCKFKHYREIIGWCNQFMRDMCNCIWAYSGIRRGRNLKQEETWALKRMQNIFQPHEMNFFKMCSENSPLTC